jgi:hypothetical protein
MVKNQLFFSKGTEHAVALHILVLVCVFDSHDVGAFDQNNYIKRIYF